MAADADLDAKDNVTRDRLVKEAVVRLVKKSLRLEEEVKSPESCFSAEADTDAPGGDDEASGRRMPSQHHVIITIDEIGATPSLLRGLCACVNDLTSTLLKFFGFRSSSSSITRSSSSSPPVPQNAANTADVRRTCKVYFVVAGTGASSAEAGQLATNPGTFSCVYLKSSAELFKALVDFYSSSLQTKLFQSSTGFPKNTSLFDRLQKLFSTPRERLTTALQLLLFDFVTNARCAALVVTKMIAELVPSDWSNDRAFDAAIHRWVTSACIDYVSMNGLLYATNPLFILLMAFAVSAFRVHFLPERMEYLLKYKLWTENSSAPSDGSLFTALCIYGGVLVDTSRRAEADDSNGEWFRNWKIFMR